MNTVSTADEIAAALAGLPGWRHEAGGGTAAGGALVKTFLFPTFRDALAFMVRAGFEAEALDHHPEWTNVYNRVAVRLNTHDAGGRVTAKDVDLARRLEAVAGARSG
jgi:4a-hydroxytetrahydrobiopterin dehydratase